MQPDEPSPTLQDIFQDLKTVQPFQPLEPVAGRFVSAVSMVLPLPGRFNEDLGGIKTLGDQWRAVEALDKQIDEDLDYSRLHRALDELSREQLNIIEHRYGLNGRAPQSIQDLSDALRMPFTRVRRLEQTALDCLRHFFFSAGNPRQARQSLIKLLGM